MARDRDTIVSLVGLRCSGKSSVGRELAQRIGRPFVDLDVELARDFAKERGLAAIPPAGEILSKHGDLVFRDAEERTLERVLSREDPCVIATGGGVVERSANRDLLRRHTTCVWLRVPVPELERRMQMQRNSSTRPALLGGDPVGEVAALAARRDALYAAVAGHVIECGTLAAPEIARTVQSLLAAEPGG